MNEVTVVVALVGCFTLLGYVVGYVSGNAAGSAKIRKDWVDHLNYQLANEREYRGAAERRVAKLERELEEVGK